MIKRIFFITTGRLRIYHFDGQLSEPLEFSADEQGLTDFSQYLQQYPAETVAVLVDVVEEDFREDTIPHVFGGDRQSVLSTKLNRIFRDTTYSHTLFQGRETEGGRRDDRVLFTALIRPDLLAPWMGQLSKHKVPVAGIYSLPLLSGQLCKHLKNRQPLCIVSIITIFGGTASDLFSGWSVTCQPARGIAGFEFRKIHSSITQ